MVGRLMAFLANKSWDMISPSKLDVKATEVKSPKGETQ